MPFRDCGENQFVRLGYCKQWCLCLVFLLFTVVAIQLPTASARQQTGSENQRVEHGAGLFPATTTLYVQLNEPGQLVQRMLDHPLRTKIEELERIRKGLNSPQFRQAKLVLALLETQIGEAWLPALQKLTASGVYFGLDAKSRAVGVAIHSGDEELLKKTAGSILGFIKGNGTEFEITDYQGGKLAVLDNVTITRINDWFMFSNRQDYLRAMIDNLVGNHDPSLANTAQFVDAWNNRIESSDAWAFANLKTLREAGLADDLFAGSTDQPAVELLFGGVLEALRGAEFASANIAIRPDAFAAHIRLPYDATNSPRQREFFFGTNGMGRAPEPIELDGLLAQVVTYRDLGSWWLSKEDLFPENVIADLAQGDSQLSTLFGGVDFGQDVLGALQPEMRLLVKQQEYAEGMKPDVPIPAFALVTRLQNPQDARRFRISFQSLVGLLNLDQSGMDRPQIEIMTTNEDGIQTTGGQYVADNNMADGLFIYNFSPALSFQDDYMVVSSSLEFAREIAEATRSLDETNTSTSNTLVNVYAKTIKQALAANRQTLVANTMVEQGMSREQAETQIELILELLDYAEGATLDYRIEPDAMSLDLQLRMADPR